MNKIKVLVSGCNGKMGQLVCQLVNESDNMEVIAGFDSASMKSSAFPVFHCLEDLEFFTENADIDVIIDFSSPECSINVLKNYACEYRVPMVIATTGFSKEQISFIETCASKIPVFFSSNMSYDVNVVKNVLQYMAPMLADSDIEILDIHHNRKKDSPSGTAIMLAEAINSSLKNSKKTIYGRAGKREKNEIGLAALRGGDVVGTHSIHFFTKFGEIEITSRENSRAAFAEGAIKAAQFLATSDKTAGLFDMDALTNL